MLDLMLGNAPHAFSCGEVYALFRPFRLHHFDPLCSCGDRNCPVWSGLRSVREDQFHAAALAQPGIRHVIDSSKDLRWVLDSNLWADKQKIPVSNVLIWKEPVDLAFSHWKRGRPVGHYRKQFLDYYERFLGLGLPYVAVRYTDLVSEPQAALQRLSAVLDLPCKPDQEQFWTKQHHHFFGSAGTAKQVAAGSSDVGLQRKFPEAFVHAFQQDLEAQDDDARLSGVLSVLDSAAANTTRAEGRLSVSSTAVRPGWYYRHMLKAWFRLYFPEQRQVVD